VNANFSLAVRVMCPMLTIILFSQKITVRQKLSLPQIGVIGRIYGTSMPWYEF
jgi:hypothetical protein